MSVPVLKDISFITMRDVGKAYSRIFCCECNKEVYALLINGKTAYPNRPDLYDLPFWQCETCENFVGTHYKHHIVSKKFEALGVIASSGIKKARQEIHKLIDPLWKNGLINRKHLYNKISKRLGYEFHTAGISEIEEARNIYRVCRDISIEVNDSVKKGLKP